MATACGPHWAVFMAALFPLEEIFSCGFLEAAFEHVIDVKFMVDVWLAQFEFKYFFSNQLWFGKSIAILEAGTFAIPKHPLAFEFASLGTGSKTQWLFGLSETQNVDLIACWRSGECKQLNIYFKNRTDWFFLDNNSYFVIAY